jgi:hypothetical protein
MQSIKSAAEPFMPVAAEKPHTKTLTGLKRPPQLEEIAFPLVRVIRRPGDGSTLELTNETRVLGIRLG